MIDSSRHDEALMRRALRLAERGRGRTRPNPIVGAVVVRAGRVIGSGWHRAAGTPHAEVTALARAGGRARGATLYVTLEPCAHHGRTPPCVDTIVRAGIRRCVVATRDPHRIVNGRGLRALRRAGVHVDVGVLEAEARAQIAGYWTAHVDGRPRVTWKLATTLDGKVADHRGRSRWISGAESRHLVHRLRRRVDAIVIGAGTARADDPRLTVRGVGGRGAAPRRVVCDTRLTLPPTLRLFAQPGDHRTIVACGPRGSRRRAEALERRGVEVWRVPTVRGRLSPRAVGRRLVQAGCYDVLLESGPDLGGAWMRAGLVDRMALFVAPRILGADGVSWCRNLPGVTLERARAGQIVHTALVGSDALIVFDVHRTGR
jgi:diaminohydroxyphosphoribosylaminopyrimidine deaminase/5-amino-6-(5-phosphoribosylamino)uracil reductase